MLKFTPPVASSELYHPILHAPIGNTFDSLIDKRIKNFISIDLSDEDILPFLHSAIENKKKGLPHTRPLEGKNIILFFEKNSTRTRLSFELAIKQLGGTSTILNSKDTHFGSGKENLRDTIQTFETYSDGIVMRVNDHQTILDAVKFSRVPIINGLSNLSHPCQCMAGLMTLIEEKGSLKDLNIVWMGQITNVAHSWIDAYLSGLGFSLNIFWKSQGFSFSYARAALKSNASSSGGATN